MHLSERTPTINKVSFRTRILIVILVTPIVSLSVFLFFLVQTYRNDKISYLYELQNENVRAVSLSVDELMRNRDIGRELDEREKLYLRRHIYKPDQFCHHGHFLTWIQASPRRFFICRDGGEIYEILASDIRAALSGNNLVKSFLVDRDGVIVADQRLERVGDELKEVYPGLQLPDWGQASHGRLSFTDHDGESYLGSFQNTKAQAMRILTVTPREITLRAVLPFLVRGVMGIVALIFVVWVLGYFLSRRLSSKIEVVVRGLHEFGQGHHDYRLTPTGSDEIDKLMIGFNSMSDKIQELFLETEKRARLSAEMELAGKVQQTFLPASRIRTGDLEVCAHVEQAANCGGDWWFHLEKPESHIFLVCDVTGHGIRSALITSAARAVVSRFQEENTSLPELMTVLNRAIFDTTGGQLQMTALLIEIAKDGHTIRYCNASHEPAVLFREGADKITYLDEIHGPRAGERRSVEFGQSFLEGANQFDLWLYTDGLRELFNPQGVQLGDRRMSKLMRAAFSRSQPIESRFAQFSQGINAFRDAAPLADDLTYLCISR